MSDHPDMDRIVRSDCGCLWTHDRHGRPQLLLLCPGHEIARDLAAGTSARIVMRPERENQQHLRATLSLSEAQRNLNRSLADLGRAVHDAARRLARRARRTP